MRDSLRWLLHTVGLRCRTYDSAEAFARDGTIDGPACLVLDVRMPGTGGLELFEALVARGLATPVLFITAHADVPMAVRAMQSGAVEFLEKPFNGQVLLDKIQRALRLDAARLAQQASRQGTRGRLQSLTPKEQEVLEGIQQGLLNKEIAARLGITARAVELRRASLMRKLAVNSLPELLRLTIAQGDDRQGPPTPAPQPR